MGAEEKVGLVGAEAEAEAGFGWACCDHKKNLSSMRWKSHLTEERAGEKSFKEAAEKTRKCLPAHVNLVAQGRYQNKKPRLKRGDYSNTPTNS